MFEGSKARQREVAYVATTVDSGVILLSGSETGKVKKKSRRMESRGELTNLQEAGIQINTIVRTTLGRQLICLVFFRHKSFIR